MALIKCPECGAQISDKAAACIHCGFPMAVDNKEYYDVIYKGFSTQDKQGRHQAEVSMHISYFTDMKIWDCLMFLRNTDQVITTGLTEENATMLCKSLAKYGCMTELQKSTQVNDENNLKVKSRYTIDDAPVICPRCRSTSVVIGTRGYSLISGFIGSNKTVNRCGKCGYKWTP